MNWRGAKRRRSDAETDAQRQATRAADVILGESKKPPPRHKRPVGITRRAPDRVMAMVARFLTADPTGVRLIFPPRVERRARQLLDLTYSPRLGRLGTSWAQAAIRRAIKEGIAPPS